jgi:hypothetical protein
MMPVFDEIWCGADCSHFSLDHLFDYCTKYDKELTGIVDEYGDVDIERCDECLKEYGGADNYFLETKR